MQWTQLKSYSAMNWIHINSIELLGTDSLLLSSRETSTIIKIDNIYDEPTVDYLIGSPNFWEGSGYEDLLLTQDGEFSLQAGQHALASRPTTACRTGSTMSPCSITTMQSAGAGRMISQPTPAIGTPGTTGLRMRSATRGHRN